MTLKVSIRMHSIHGLDRLKQIPRSLVAPLRGAGGYQNPIPYMAGWLADDDRATNRQYNTIHRLINASNLLINAINNIRNL